MQVPEHYLGGKFADWENNNTARDNNALQQGREWWKTHWHGGSDPRQFMRSVLAGELAQSAEPDRDIALHAQWFRKQFVPLRVQERGKLEATWTMAFADFLYRHYRVAAKHVVQKALGEQEVIVGTPDVFMLTEQERASVEAVLRAMYRSGLRGKLQRWLPPTDKGTKIPATYDTQVEAWYTRPQLVEVGDRQLVVEQRFPGGTIRHWAERMLFEAASALPFRKTLDSKWREKRALVSDIPMASNGPADSLVIPFIPGVNGYDLFGHSYRSENDWGSFVWARGMVPVVYMELLPAVAVALKVAHGDGICIGEATLPHTLFVAPDLVRWTNVDTEYNENVVELDRRAYDLLHLISSVGNAYNFHTLKSGLPEIVERLLLAYGDSIVIERAIQLAGQSNSVLAKLLWNVHGQFRVGAPYDKWQATKSLVQEMGQDIMYQLSEFQKDR